MKCGYWSHLPAAVWLVGCNGDKVPEETGDSGVDCSDPDADRYDGQPVPVALGVGPECGTALVSSQMLGENPGDLFGNSMSGEDVSGDTLSDVLVGSYSYDAVGVGYVFLSPLDAHETPATADASIRGDSATTFGGNVIGIGESDGDGYGDVVAFAFRDETSHFVFRGPLSGPSTLEEADAWFESSTGSAVAGGDLDGDGLGDLLFNVRGGGAISSSYYFYQTWTGGKQLEEADGVVEGIAADDYCGVAPAGDTNGDGIADTVFVCLYIEKIYVMEGIVLGEISVSDAEHSMSITYGRCHWKGVGGGDMNGDGYDDIIVNEPCVDYGEAWVLASPLPTTMSLNDATSSWIGHYESDDWFATGLTLHAADLDLNADGYADYMMGSDCGQTSGHLCEHVVLSPVEGSHSVADAAWGVTSSYDIYYDYIVSYKIGDANGDGYDDVGLGENLHDADAPTDPYTDEGSAWLLSGGEF